MKTTTIFSLLIIFCLKIQAQTVIEGSVLDAQGKSGDAIVTVTAKGIVAYWHLQRQIIRVTIVWR